MSCPLLVPLKHPGTEPEHKTDIKQITQLTNTAIGPNIGLMGYGHSTENFGGHDMSRLNY